MLDFYFADEGSVPENQDESQFVASLSLDDCRWLIKFGFIQEGTFSFFDSSSLTPTEVQTALKFLERRRAESCQTAGFSSPAIERLNKILTRAAERGFGLTTFCD